MSKAVKIEKEKFTNYFNEEEGEEGPENTAEEEQKIDTNNT